MTEATHREIERKYLIRFPNLELLQAQPGAEQWEIIQIYLTVEDPGETRRIRQVVCNGKIRYYKTFKRRLSGLSAWEDEGEIDQMTFMALSREQQPGCKPLGKTRYRIPYKNRVLEVDIYPFWLDRAILEIEMENEAETPLIPDYLSVIRDVSNDLAYKNRSLAEKVIYEEI